MRTTPVPETDQERLARIERLLARRLAIPNLVHYEEAAWIFAADVEFLLAKAKQSQWVAVSERLPPEPGDYLVLDDGVPCTESWDGLTWKYVGHITHWCPLPPEKPQ